MYILAFFFFRGTLFFLLSLNSMRVRFLFLLMSLALSSLSAQRILPLETSVIQGTENIFIDDYDNVYLYKNEDFSLTKYDAMGMQRGRMMLTLPFKIQNVQNPLNIVLFSENAQEIKLIDQNLNEIQKIDLRPIGFIKMAYVEDLQQIWLLDESSQRLLQYNYREGNIINSFPIAFSTEDIVDMLIFDNQAYMITRDKLMVYHIKAGKLSSQSIDHPIRLRREGNNLFISTKNQILQWENTALKIIFEKEDARIVDKNSNGYFEMKDNKVYLYTRDISTE